jgi:hypothetical protein
LLSTHTQCCYACSGGDDELLITEVAKETWAAEQAFAGLLDNDNRMPTAAVYEGTKYGLSI